MDDAADLSRLADIVVPPPPPWWPPAPGWWVLAAVLLAALALLAFAAARRWRRNAYRRQALAEIDGLGTVTRPADVVALSTILKRTALVAYPRPQVAALTGPDWAAFLDRTGGEGGFRERACFAGSVTNGVAEDGAALLASARRWVKRHPGGR
ncbi:DUF4381 domain-containing protein [Ancylobacter mangrovi]|uniref:DUF4381 domain-containing protein n=1 Tax=Ancylobacter mangrovi TaxID=2972472 RepID=UPI002161D5BD|nr:DUF4381 domain-containing protein [Ancylobacter mangrovi]MCS0503328.1 DUF4381 domain-containing protein [Ancylobacter mangrovi]